MLQWTAAALGPGLCVQASGVLSPRLSVSSLVAGQEVHHRGALVDQVAELPRMFCPGVPVLQAWVVSAVRSDGVWSSELAHPWECMLCSSPVCIHTCTQHWRVHWNFPLFRSTDRSVQRRELGRSNCLLPKFPSQGIFVYFRSSIIVVQDDAHQRAPAYTHNQPGF